MNEFRRCLIELDVSAVMALWPTVHPGQQRPKTTDDALMVLHYARTQTKSIPFDLRAYSHRWLCERAIPSGLPDELRPKAERLYPRMVEAVGISVKAMTEASIPIAKAMERAMAEAVEDAYANGQRSPEFVKARMNEARDRVLRG